MDTRSYIESGILELYAMDALPADERAEVERRVATDPEIARELEEIRGALARLDEVKPREPRPGLRASVLAAIEADDAAPDVTAPAVAPVVRALPRPSSRYRMAASWVLLALSLGAAIYFAAQWRSALAEVENLRAENERLARAGSVLAARAGSAEQALSLIGSADVRAVQLAGTEHAPEARPVVFWNTRSREVHLVARNLPPPPAGRQYQLWAIRGDSRVDAGVLDIGAADDGVQRLKDVEAAEAFAVTLERAGGSPTPSLDAIVALGQL